MGTVDLSQTARFLPMTLGLHVHPGRAALTSAALFHLTRLVRAAVPQVAAWTGPTLCPSSGIANLIGL